MTRTCLAGMALVMVTSAWGCSKQQQESPSPTTEPATTGESNDTPATGAARTVQEHDAAPVSVPEFQVEFREISRFPTCLSNRRIKVTADGRVYSVVNQTECPDGERWSTPYPSTPVRTLTSEQRRRMLAVIRESGFLALAPKHANTEYEDGSIQEIEVTIAGTTHTVVMENTDHPAFEKVRRSLMGVAL